MDIESEYLDKKASYDKVAVGLEIDKQALEKECDTFQVTILLFIFAVISLFHQFCHFVIPFFLQLCEVLYCILRFIPKH